MAFPILSQKKNHHQPGRSHLLFHPLDSWIHSRAKALDSWIKIIQKAFSHPGFAGYLAYKLGSSKNGWFFCDQGSRQMVVLRPTSILEKCCSANSHLKRCTCQLGYCIFSEKNEKKKASKPHTVNHHQNHTVRKAYNTWKRISFSNATLTADSRWMIAQPVVSRTIVAT